MRRRNTIDDILNRLVKQEDGCWVWPGAKSGTKKGTQKPYGRVSFDGRPQTVHVIVYKHLVGPIPEGLQLDHTCFNRLCANPAHLEPVTAKVNTQRGFVHKRETEPDWKPGQYDRTHLKKKRASD
jgi:hypothetical protein